MGMKTRSRLTALLLAALMLLSVVPMGAMAATPPAGDEDYAYMHSYVSKTDTPGIYKVTMVAEFKLTPVEPPALVTFVLDGTASMKAGINDKDGSYLSTSRDVVVRKSVIEALKILLDTSYNANPDRTFVNVVMFGSHAHLAVSLTEWATRSSKGPSDASLSGVASWGNKWLPGVVAAGGQWGNAGYSVTVNNTARVDGDYFVKLTNGDGHINPVLAGLFDYPLPSGYNAADQTLANTIKSAYFFGNDNVTDVQRFPSSLSGTWVNPGVQLAYDALKAEVNAVNASSQYTQQEKDGMNRTVLILADGGDSMMDSSQSWGAAIKAPNTVTVSPYIAGASNTGSATITVPYGSAVSGLDADIWSLATGKVGFAGGMTNAQIEAEIRTNEFDGTASPPAYHWKSNYSAMVNLAKHMAGLTLPFTSQAQIDAYTSNTDWKTLGSTNFTSRVGGAQPHQYMRAITENDAMRFFKQFATASGSTGGTTGALADVKLSAYYNVYQMPGKPTLHTWSTDASTSPTATYTGGRINWDLGALKDGSSYLEFYVKMAEGLDESLYYPLFDRASLSYTMSNTGSGNSYTIDFPMAYVSGKGSIKTDEGNLVGNGALNGGGGTSGDGGAGASGAGVSGGQQHQQNREMASNASMSSFVGGGEDIRPDIQSAKAGAGANGRSKVSIELANGAKMRYQWQFKNATGEWEDIFGANGSHYTLGKQFTAGKEYELRCKITNPAGNVFYGDVVKLTMKKGGGSLQKVETAKSAS